MSDLISRDKALNLVLDVCNDVMDECETVTGICGEEVYTDVREVDAILKCNKGIRNGIRQLPSEQPEITLESAIDYLHSIGWLQKHDKILAESAHPEIIRCKDCKHLQAWRSEESAKKFGQIYECARNVFDRPKPYEDFCSHAERRTDVTLD